MEDETYTQVLSDGQKLTIHIVANFSTFISLGAEICLFVLFFKTWSVWNLSGRMIICLTISCLLYTIANLLTNFNEGGDTDMCQLDGFLRTFGILSSFVWAWSIAKNAYYKVTDEYFRVNQLTEAHHIIKGFGFPLIFALIPLFGIGKAEYGLISESHSQCGITSDSRFLAIFWSLGLSIIPTFVGSILVVRYYYLLMKVSQEFEETLGINSKRFMIYPFALFVLWLPTVIFWIALQVDGYVFWIDALRVLLSYSLGLLHSTSYIIQAMRIKSNKEEKKDLATELTTVRTDNFSGSCTTEEDVSRSERSSQKSSVDMTYVL